METQPYKVLFLDRDGVINERIPGDYVAHWSEFQFSPGACAALAYFAQCFPYIFVVTNQQGIGKGKMSSEELSAIHTAMLAEIRAQGGRIDGIYTCPDLASMPNNCRKPSPALALRAKEDFPDVEFHRAIMVGDSVSDIQFGQNLGMFTVLITGKSDESTQLEQALSTGLRIDQRFDSLWHLAQWLKETQFLLPRNHTEDGTRF